MTTPDPQTVRDTTEARAALLDWLEGRTRIIRAGHVAAVLDERNALAARVAELEAERVQDTRAIIDIVNGIERNISYSAADMLRNHFGNRARALAPRPTTCVCGCPLGQPCRCDDSVDHEPADGSAR